MKQSYSIHDLLDDPKFRKRPAMYIGEFSISKLFMLMIGYSYCEDFNNLKLRGTCPPFIMFLPWVVNQTNRDMGSINWDRHLLENNNGDEVEAFKEFFVHYDTFKQQKPIYIQKAIITDTEKDFFITRKNYNETNIAADSIYIINYSGDFGCSTHTKHDFKWHTRWEYGFEETINYLKSSYGPTLQFETIPKKDIAKVYKRIDMQLL